MISGRLPAAGEVLLEKHLAQHHRLAAGDTIRVDVAGGARELRVSGIGVSAEYLWVARNASDIFPSPDEFGVGWMAVRARGRARNRDDRRRGRRRREPSARREGAGADANAITASAAARPGDRVLASTTKEQLVGIRLLQMDVDGYRGMAAFFPVFFLGVGAFIVAALLARMVDAQRAVLGTLMALGVGRAEILAQVLGHALALGVARRIAGAVAGTRLLAPRSRARTQPTSEFRSSPRTCMASSRSSASASASSSRSRRGCSRPSRSCLAPAEAMRPTRPSTDMLARLARNVPAPLAIRLALRDVLGRPLRSLSTALGVSAALVLVLATGSMLDSMRTTFIVLFDDARRYDLRVDLAAPESASSVEARFSTITDVTRVEALIDLPVTIDANGRTSQALLQGLRDHSQLARSVDIDGRAVEPHDGEIVITRALAHELGVAIGDALQIRRPGGEATFRVGGFADGTMGPTVSARVADVESAFGLGDRVTAVAITTRGDAAPLRAAVASMNDVVHVEDTRALRDQVAGLMGLGWAMLGMMLFFGAVLAAAILFNTATLGILERRRELATLRALGRTQREIAVGITLEHAWLAAFGLALGYPLATYTSRKLLALYSSDLFHLPYVMTSKTVAFSTIGIAAVLFVAQWPALRRLARASLAESVRARE